MRTLPFRAVILPLCLCWIPGCKRLPLPDFDAVRGGAVEHIDAEERAAAAKLKPAKDPVDEEIYAFRLTTRKAYNTRRFDELEKNAADFRAEKKVFGNGSWKIVHFYQSFECRDDEPESMWQLHDRIHQDWIAAKPESMAARAAYADFLASYAWHARGSGFSDTVSGTGWQLFEERLDAARKVLEKARALPEGDAFWWVVALRVALGQGWSKPDYDALVAEAHTFEPKFWGYDTARAYSLLPRWHGEPGDWEAYAEETAARPDGLGAETYARIVIYLRGYHENIFRDSKASWPKTREGLAQMRKKHPDSLDIVSNTALLATMAEDRALAKEMFDRLGDTYLPRVWGKPEHFVHYRKWAETGNW